MDGSGFDCDVTRTDTGNPSEGWYGIPKLYFTFKHDANQTCERLYTKLVSFCVLKTNVLRCYLKCFLSKKLNWINFLLTQNRSLRFSNISLYN